MVNISYANKIKNSFTKSALNPDLTNFRSSANKRDIHTWCKGKKSFHFHSTDAILSKSYLQVRDHCHQKQLLTRKYTSTEATIAWFSTYHQGSRFASNQSRIDSILSRISAPRKVPMKIQKNMAQYLPQHNLFIWCYTYKHNVLQACIMMTPTR